MKRVFILNFHGLGEPPSSQSQSDELYWTSPPFFEAILELVRERTDVMVTFDDSYESDYSIALPLLKASKIKARFFVVAGRVDKKGFLSSEQIQTLCCEGMTIGSHGMYHRRWSALSDRELNEEVVEARDRVEQITGTHIVEAACPFGSYNRRVLARLRMCGYNRVYTSDGGPANAESWIQPRNTIVRGDNLERVSGIITETTPVAKTVLSRLKFMLKRLR